MQADFNRLKIFFHIFSRLSISGAADELHITPSAVSQQLKKLEAEIKAVLFTRLHKRLVPTQAGRRLFDLVAPIIKDLQAGLSSLEDEWQEPTGLLTVGAPMEFGSIYLPHVMYTFGRKYPKVRFELKLGRPSSLLPRVNSGELDFAFSDTFPTKQQHHSDFGIFSIRPVIEEQVVLACSKKYYRESLKGEESLDMLQQASFISQQKDARALNNWFLHHFNRRPSRLNIVLTVESHQAVVSGVRHHLGLGIIVSHLVADEVQSGSLVILQAMKQQAINRISIVQLLDKVPTLKEKYFLEHFIQTAQNSKTLKGLELCIGERGQNEG